MKLLFDQNLSFKLSRKLADIFPSSNQVRLLGMDRTDDAVVWEYAKVNGFTLVSKDSDYSDRSALLGHPPKVIWLRCGNQSTAHIEALLRSHHAQLLAFENDAAIGCIEIY